jgi:uncharacterized membrane protein YccF (DUF307 family)
VKAVLNIIWLVLAGLWLAIGYAIAGIVMFILLITIPFGVQALKLARFSPWPFGRTLVKKESAGGASVVGSILWLVLAGWWLAIAHLFTALLQAITIIGIPLAAANVKLVPAALWPFGREIVPTVDVAAAMAAYSDRSAEAVSVDAALSPSSPESSAAEPAAIEGPSESRQIEQPPGSRS